MLLGGGDAHLQLLRAFARERPAGVEAVLLVPAAERVHTAMLSGLVAGQHTLAQCTLALAPLAAAAGVTLVAGTVAGLDATARVVRLADGRTAEYELLSIDPGTEQSRELLPGAREHALFVRPAETFAKLLPAVVTLAQERVLDVVVVGGGAAGFELALAFEQRLNGAGPERVRVALVAGGSGPLSAFAPAVQATAARALVARRITVFRERAAALRPGAVVLASGARLACDVPVLTCGFTAPPWLAGSGLALDERGGVQTGATLQSLSHPEVVATADARAGVALAENLRRLAGGGALRPWVAPTHRLALLSCGGRRAIAVWGGWSATGRWAGWWKDRVDRGQVSACAAVAAAPPGAIRAA